MLTAKDIRARFLQFFAERSHNIVSSAPIVIKNDPTLLFTNAGMNQFKDIFLGDKKPEFQRTADTQKCLRVSGKHNDLEEVGKDTYHHTMFEMLGNWSFGDYFKAEAIAWAWELLSDVYKINTDHLYATVFAGDESDGLETDNESFDYWKKFLPEERILKFGRKDNFWEMGETGPCGPCSEIHIDIRPEEDRKKIPGRQLVNTGHPQVIEIWNLVFIQFNRHANGSLSDLPQRHVDTGMGFERLAMVLQGKTASYDTDIFRPLIEKIEALSSHRYGQSESTDMAIRVVADHIRAITFTIADAQLPSNTGAGYVVRRILRRAVRYGYSFLDIQEPFLHQLVPVLADQFAGVFPEINQQLEFIQRVIREEEINFRNTLERGLSRFENYMKEEGGKTPRIISGVFAFELYDTYGFPIDLTRLMAQEEGYSVNMKEFEGALKQQKNRSRRAAAIDRGDWTQLREDDKEEFVGYDYLETDVHIVRYRYIKTRDKQQYQLVFQATPFYAESGGQVGDTGWLKRGDETIAITDTKKENDLIIHYTNTLPADLNGRYKAVVDSERRAKIASNHSVTHLLHAALRQVLGKHVQQKGSYVGPEYLRFDFSHFEKMSPAEIARAESTVNEKIRANIQRGETRNMPMAEALKQGAMALFGEKYGDVVRVITFDPDYSVELCGGTHVAATGQIGIFKITAESAIAAGVRRIEAITGSAALGYFEQKEADWKSIAELVKNPTDPAKGVLGLVEENNKLRRELQQLQQEQAGHVKEELKQQMIQIGEAVFIGAIIDLPADAIKNLCFALKQEFPHLLICLGTEQEGKALLSIAIGDDLLKNSDLQAGQLVRELAKEIQGGGGGQPFFATAGGKHPDGLQAAIDKAKTTLENKVSPTQEESTNQ